MPAGQPTSRQRTEALITTGALCGFSTLDGTKAEHCFIRSLKVERKHSENKAKTLYFSSIFYARSRGVVPVLAAAFPLPDASAGEWSSAS